MEGTLQVHDDLLSIEVLVAEMTESVRKIVSIAAEIRATEFLKRRRQLVLYENSFPVLIPGQLGFQNPQTRTS
jgi:hypothetical protein